MHFFFHGKEDEIHIGLRIISRLRILIMPRTFIRLRLFIVPRIHIRFGSLVGVMHIRHRDTILLDNRVENIHPLLLKINCPNLTDSIILKNTACLVSTKLVVCDMGNKNNIPSMSVPNEKITICLWV